MKFRKSGELSHFTEITLPCGALGKASEDHGSCFGSVASRTEGLEGCSDLAPLEDPPDLSGNPIPQIRKQQYHPCFCGAVSLPAFSLCLFLCFSENTR